MMMVMMLGLLCYVLSVCCISWIMLIDSVFSVFGWFSLRKLMWFVIYVCMLGWGDLVEMVVEVELVMKVVW